MSIGNLKLVEHLLDMGTGGQRELLEACLLITGGCKGMEHPTLVTTESCNLAFSFKKFCWGRELSKDLSVMHVKNSGLKGSVHHRPNVRQFIILLKTR